MTYTTKGREVLLKSRMRENLKFGSVRGAHSNPGAITPKRGGYEFYSTYFMYNEKVKSGWGAAFVIEDMSRDAAEVFSKLNLDKYIPT